MGPIIVVGAGLLAMLWVTGWLTPARLKLVSAATLALVALRVLAMGRPLIAAALLGFAGWLAFRPRRGAAAISIDEARRLLGVDPTASEAEINAAYRRLIAEVHPDRGGSEAMSSKVNTARDVLLQHLGSSARSPN